MKLARLALGACALALLAGHAPQARAERVQFDPVYNHVVCDSGCGSPVIFTPTAGATANLAVTTTSSDVALPAGSTVIITNAGAGDAAFRVQTGAGTAVTTDMVLKAGAAVAIAPPSGGHISAITASGSTSLNMQGGVGGATGYGVGPGGGGGGAVTVADGADVSLGAKADGAAASDTATASLIALIKRIAQNLTTLNSTAGASIAGGSNTIGNTGALAKSSGSLTAVIQGDANAFLDMSTATTTQIVALSGATKIYVTGYVLHASGTTNAKFVYGTGTNCATGTTQITPNYNFAASDGIAHGNGLGVVFTVPSGNALCVVNSAAQVLSAAVSFTQF